MMREVARLAGLDLAKVSFLTEPEAAAISYATPNGVEPGEVVAVYDSGGGTFDAALMRRTGQGFASIGRPEGMDRFGGIDIDAAIVAHVDQSLDGPISAMDPDDPAVQAGVARLRDDARAAGKDLMAGFPGCEKAATALIHNFTANLSFDQQTSVLYMICGNVATSIGVSEPNGTDISESTTIVFNSMVTSQAKVAVLPLQH